MRHIPILGSILRGICVRAVRRLLEDLHTVIHKTNSGMSLDEVLGSGKRPSEADARFVSSCHRRAASLYLFAEKGKERLKDGC